MNVFTYYFVLNHAFSALMQLFGRREGHPAWGAGMVIYLERGADLHIARLIPLPLCLLLYKNPDLFYISGTSLPG